MSRNNEEGEYLSQAEIDAIIDEIIENEPIPAVKEHLIKYEKEYRRKRDQQKLEKHQLNEENETYDKINHPHDKTVRLMLSNSQEAANLINLALKTDFVKANQIEVPGQVHPRRLWPQGIFPAACHRQYLRRSGHLIQRSAQQAEAPLMDTLPWLKAEHR